MPYVITTWHNEDAAPMPVIPKPKDTRTAIATLDEAREAAYYEVDATSPEQPSLVCDEAEQARNLPDSGGTIGPLPDGTVIEVRPVSWADITDELVNSMDDAPIEADDIIAAFNSR